MPIQDTLQILVPGAADIGRGVIQTREYPVVIYVQRENAFTNIHIEKITYSPSWAKVQAAQYKSDIEIARNAGADGTIGIEFDITDRESQTLGLENFSIDTDVRFTIHFRSWQYGES